MMSNEEEIRKELFIRQQRAMALADGWQRVHGASNNMETISNKLFHHGDHDLAVELIDIAERLEEIGAELEDRQDDELDQIRDLKEKQRKVQERKKRDENVREVFEYHGMDTEFLENLEQ